MDEYIVCETLSEAVEVVEATFKAHCQDIGDVDLDSSAQLAYYEVEEAIGLIALVDDVPWDKIPLLYVPEANLTETDKTSLAGWMMFSAPTEDGEMTCLREAGEDCDEDEE